MADLYAECDWDGQTLILTLPEDPDVILVQLFAGRFAPRRTYVPKRRARSVAVFSDGTDFTVGHTECGACHGSVNPCAKWCEHCGAKFEGDE